MRLANLLNPDLIFVNQGGDTREEIYKDVFNKMKDKLGLADETEHQVGVMIDREDTTKIPYEKGIALPHSRTVTSPDLHVGLAILGKPLKLKCNDIDPAQVVIMSLISENTSDLYLLVLSAFSRYLIKAENMAKLISARSPGDIIDILHDDKVEVKHNVTAEEVMQTEFPQVRKDDSISKALDIFVGENKKVLPVTDQDMHLVGVLDAHAVIERAVPEYIMMMDNLNFLTSFEPFEKFLKEEESIKVSDLMRDPIAVIPLDNPLIQLTVKLIKGPAATLFVVDGEDKLVGLISIRELIKNVLRR
ncbi:MAG: PTS sugar transporter subunit IIA [Victivallales bacterium]|nr:PTS sugar transporter subunit IIA [Victivallales bacterium]